MAKRRCSCCILSEAYPGIEFDDQGVCNFCRDEIVEKTVDADIEESRTVVDVLIEAAKAKGAEYDAILCYSGGKDSTYTLKRAVERYGLKVLAFTLDNGFLSPEAFANMERAADALGVDRIVFRPSRRNYEGIIKASLVGPLYARATARRISAGCQSCIWIVNNMALKIALEKGSPLILAGFTLGQVPAHGIYYKNDYRFLLDSRSKPLASLRDAVGDGVLPYLTIREGLLKSPDDYPHTVNLLALEDVSEKRVLEEVAEIGWVQPGGVDGCSSNCELNVLNNYAHELKYGFNPYELEFSLLVRRGLLSREEALAKVTDQSEAQLRRMMAALGLEDSDFPTGGVH
jgi:hypothetical protein